MKPVFKYKNGDQTFSDESDWISILAETLAKLENV